LSAADAQKVEEAFSVRVAVIPAAGTTTNETTSPADVRTLAKNIETAPVDNSVLSFPKPRRLRDRSHIRHVMTQACLICGRRPSDPHHLRFAQSRALSRKVSDEFTVPLCRTHHREVHRQGDEEAWWQKTGIDPFPAARALWLETHPLRRLQATVASDEVLAANDKVRAVDLPPGAERPNGKRLHAIAISRTSKSQKSKANPTARKP
jgi:hypothetical protein